MYEHRKTPPSASGLSYDNSKTLKIRVPPGEPDGAFTCLVLEAPGFSTGAHVSRAWLLGLHDQIERLLDLPRRRTLFARIEELEGAAQQVVDNRDETGRLDSDIDDLKAALDDVH